MKSAIIALAAAALAAPAALAGSVSGPLTDTQLNGVFTDEVWVAEGRYGNNANNGDWELGINGSFGLNNTNFTWGPSVAEYSAVISADPNGVFMSIFERGGTDAVASISQDVAGDDFNPLALRTRAPREGLASISNISGAGQSFGETLTVETPSSASPALSLIFTGFDFNSDAGFEVAFDFTWRWNDARGSAPAFQLKAGNVIPLPGAAGMALAGLGLAAARRRR